MKTCRSIFRVLTIVTVLSVVFCVMGCAMITPHTSVGLNPLKGTIDFYDSKDSNLKAKGIEAKDGDKELSVESVSITGTSSTVVKENVNQMLAFAEQQRASNEGISAAMVGITNIMGNLLPLVAEITAANTSQMTLQSASSNETKLLVAEVIRQLLQSNSIATTQPAIKE